MPACRHGNGVRADCPGTLDVVRGIPDHPDISWIDIALEMARTLAKGLTGNVVAIVNSIGKAAEREVIPELVMAEFAFTPGANVPG